MTELEKVLLTALLNTDKSAPQAQGVQPAPVQQSAPAQQPVRQNTDDMLVSLLLKNLLQQNINTSQVQQTSAAPQQNTLSTPSAGFTLNQNPAIADTKSTTDLLLEKILALNIATAQNKPPETSEEIIGNIIAPPIPEFGAEPNGVNKNE